MSKCIDMSGMTLGRLTVLRRAESDSHGRVKWLCRCTCGTEKVIGAAALRNGTTRSCGCLHREVVAAMGRSCLKHGGRKTPEYRSYSMMRERCLNPNSKSFPDYGGRGIAICQRWLDDFRNFLADMGPRPEGTSLDRIDVNRGYEPGNCRWATRSQQARNTRLTEYITIGGITMSKHDWIKGCGLDRSTVYKRLQRGIPFHEAIT